MKVKNVVRGLMREYDLEEINIIADDKVIFSGTQEQYYPKDVDMILYKKEIENTEVKKRLMFTSGGHYKAFIFI